MAFAVVVTTVPPLLMVRMPRIAPVPLFVEANVRVPALTTVLPAKVLYPESV